MGRSPCCKGISDLRKGPWTPEEDEKLVSYIQHHGLGSWRTLPKAAGLNRCGKSCRLRWTNYLRPDIKRGRFTEEEEDMIIKLHFVLGNKWSRIATHLPGRTDNEIKNYWNTNLRKKLLHIGIDPITHKPITDLNLLANLSQILSNPSNLGGSLMNNPWDINNALRVQPNVAVEVVKLQILQNIVQILNMDQTMSLNLGMISSLNELGTTSNSTNNAMCSRYLGLCQVPNYVNFNQETLNNYDNKQELYQSMDNDSNCNKGLSCTTITSYETLDEIRLPSLVNISPEGSTINQIESNTNSTNDDFFEGWEKLLDDGSSDFWKEFIN